jgi:hypothetical protein
MNAQQFCDFLMALGQEFCGALSPPVPENLITPQDAYEVWLATFRQEPSPERLASLSRPELSRLRDECERYFECPLISIEQTRSAITRTLARWPAGNAG